MKNLDKRLTKTKTKKMLYGCFLSYWAFTINRNDSAIQSRSRRHNVSFLYFSLNTGCPKITDIISQANNFDPSYWINLKFSQNV